MSSTGQRASESNQRLRRAFFYHVHPLKVTERALRIRTTLGLGVLSLGLFFCLVISGLLLMFYYIPAVANAYQSMQDIQYAVSFGAFVRAVHRWSAHGMVVCVVLHLFRVAAQAAYRKRALNWFFGLGLLATTLALAFTGYLLPWDQLSFWAVTVATNLADHLPAVGPLAKKLFLGADKISQATLLRFYTLHVAVLPSLLVLLGALHLWRIRKDSGLACHREALPTVPAWPHLVLREAILMLGLLIVVCLVSHFFPAPLGSPPDYYQPANPDKAPWYFLWLQEMVSYSEWVGGFLYPCAVLILLFTLPMMDRQDAFVGRWFGDRTACRVTWVVGFIASLGFGLFAWVYFSVVPRLPVDTFFSQLANPAFGMLCLALVVFGALRWLIGQNRTACFSALVVLLVGIVGCLVLGWCRGPDWVLYVPWEEMAVCPLT
jgi:quinol-cytochrome oxidoreductase complex cytochrome b subunit